MATLREAFGLLESGRIPAAESLFRQLHTATSPPSLQADALNGLGLCAEALGRFDDAEGAYRAALMLMPAEPEYLNNLAICLIRSGRSDQGLAVFEQLARLNPPPEAFFNLALALASIGQQGPAIQAIAALLKRFPQALEPLNWLLELVRTLDRHSDIFVQLQQWMAADPDEPVYQLALATLYQNRGNSPLALRYYRAALRTRPDLLGAWQPLIQLLRSEGLFAEALNLVRQRYGNQATLESLVEQVITLQQPVPASEAESQRLIADLLNLLEAQKPPASQIYLPQILPFYPVYQLGDPRVLQEKLAAFFSGFLAWNTDPNRPPRQRLPRLGILSMHLHTHSVTDLLLRALLTLLGSEDFESFLFFYSGARSDDLTAQLKALATQAIEIPDSLPQALRLIAAQELDLLIYTDIGMEPYSYALALNRLARFQLVLPGHPVTTGMPTIDYFVSGEALEPAQGDQFYSESLVRLPGLPDYLKPLMPPAASREELGLPQGNLYFCPMNIFKLQPAFDAVLARILARDPSARILLLQFKNQLHLQLQARFSKAWPEHADRLLFLPWTPQAEFFQRLQIVDVLLDTFPFGGGNTSYQALGVGCPIICLDVPWQKGRWTQAMYQLMGMPDLIAPTPEAYAELAVRVATDKAWQAELRQQIYAKSTVLFDNPIWSQALLNFCRDLVSHD